MTGIIDNRKKYKKKDIISIKKNDDFYRIYHVTDKNGESFIFKDISLCPNYIYHELLIKYLAKYVNINCVNPSVISINTIGIKFSEKIGIKEESCTEDGYKLYLGYDIMDEYLDFLIKTDNTKMLEEQSSPNMSRTDIMKNYMNNLKNIYEALCYFFKNNPNKNIIIEELYDELMKRFCFDYITMQDDRSLGNWGILINDEGRVKFAKMFDNEEAFNSSYVPEQKVLNCNEKKDEILDVFFNNMIPKYKDMFVNMYNELTPEVLQDMIIRMELENGKIESNIYKVELIKNYESNYRRITNILKKNNLLKDTKIR